MDGLHHVAGTMWPKMEMVILKVEICEPQSRARLVFTVSKRVVRKTTLRDAGQSGDAVESEVSMSNERSRSGLHVFSFPSCSLEVVAVEA